MVWAFAKLAYADAPPLEASASQAAWQIHAFSEQGLVNTVWAFAKLQFSHAPFMGAISAVVQEQLAKFTPRYLSNISWAFSALKVHDGPMLAAIAQASQTKIREFNCQDLANMLWSMATLAVSLPPEMLAPAVEATALRLHGFESQGLANTSWSLAVLEFRDVSLMHAMSAVVSLKASSFSSQELCNTIWAFATLKVLDERFFQAVADAVYPRLFRFLPVDLANTAWAFATLEFRNKPLVAAIKEVAEQRFGAWCSRPEDDAAVVNVLSVVEALGRLDLKESLVSAASAALCDRAQRLDQSYQEQPLLEELRVTTERLAVDSVTEPRVLASFPGLCVLWKPPGWSAALEDPKSESDKDFALRRWLQRHFGKSSPIVYDEGETYGLVHRLDRFTSGPLLWAPCYRGLFEARLQFAARQVCKEYLCIGQGWLQLSSGPRHLKAPLKEELAIEGELQLARSRVNRISGKWAHTEVSEAVLLSGPDGESYTLMKVRLHTGRTHQIRCHLSHEGHPLLGDPVYGGPTPGWSSRHWLHAWRLQLRISSGKVDLQVPVPVDLQEALRRLDGKERHGTQKELESYM